MVKNIRHSGIVVNDIDMAKLFYCDILGMKIVSESTHLRDAFLEKVLDTTYLNFSIIKMVAPNGSMLELYVSQDMESGRESFAHVAFTVGNLLDIYDKLVDQGFEPLSIPCLDNQKKHKVMFVEDFNGNLIELVEELEIKK